MHVLHRSCVWVIRVQGSLVQCDLLMYAEM